MQALPMSGKVALVTGGSSGIGLATALAFVREGARVAIASRDPQRGAQALEKLRQMAVAAGAAAGADTTIWIQADVAKAAEAEAMVASTLRAFGRLDYAFNNGGSGGNAGPVQEILEENWDLTIDGYLKSVWLSMKYELFAMLHQGGDEPNAPGKAGMAIVNNASVDGERAFPWDPVYSAAKHGVIGLTQSAAVQYGRTKIRINAVCPGWIRTPPVEEMIAADPRNEERVLMHQPGWGVSGGLEKGGLRLFNAN
jgi:NAD(P)-dependent dehydrogenase (short-subunit alcohol dehydrogenase family)